jgi:hypothetical protein
MPHRKLSFSLPETLVQDLDYISARIKVSRSALLSNLITEPASDLRGLLEGVPENPTDEDILRARGASTALIEKRLNNFANTSCDNGDDLNVQMGLVL